MTEVRFVERTQMEVRKFKRGLVINEDELRMSRMPEEEIINRYLQKELLNLMQDIPKEMFEVYEEDSAFSIRPEKRFELSITVLPHKNIPPGYKIPFTKKQKAW